MLQRKSLPLSTPSTPSARPYLPQILGIATIPILLTTPHMSQVAGPRCIISNSNGPTVSRTSLTTVSRQEWHLRTPPSPVAKVALSSTFMTIPYPLIHLTHPSTNLKLSMRHLQIGHHGHCPCHARSSRASLLGPPRGLGLTRHASCLFLCERKKPSCWPKHVVCVFPCPSCLSPLISLFSLIYQLLEYEKKLKGDKGTPSDSDPSSGTDDEEEWGRRRQMMEEASDNEAEERESNLVMQEAKALDKAMEDRIVARKSSASSIGSTGSGLGMGPVWRTRYASRKRTGSLASNKTNGSFLSEDLVEEEEEQELLGLGGGFDTESHQSRAAESVTSSPDDEHVGTPRTLVSPAPRTARPPPSAPVWKTSFSIPPPPATAIRSTFELPSRSKLKNKPGLSILPPVPSSPVNLVIETDEPLQTKVQPRAVKTSLPLPPVRQRAESRKLVPPPLHLRNSALRKASNSVSDMASMVSTPSQTLFVFPPSPTLTTRTPSTMTLMSNVVGPVPFPSLSTPRVSTFHSKGRTRSFIGLRAPPTPTVAFSKVDVRGHVGLT